MKNKIITLGALLLTLLVTSCHSDSDVIMSYANNDILSFREAENSFAGKYRVFWKAMNTNYALWDYEKQNGLDWDDHYNKFLPKFEALDEKQEVSDEELRKLMQEMATPLHDGHLYIEFHNHKTNNFVAVSPGHLRTDKREEIKESDGFVPSLVYYRADLADYKDVSTRIGDQFGYITSTNGIGCKWAESRLIELQSKASPTESELKEMNGLSTFLTEMNDILQKKLSIQSIEKYNELALTYSYLNIPFLDPINLAFSKSGIRVTYGLFNDGIVYLHFDGFNLSAYLDDRVSAQMITDRDTHTLELINRVKDAWKAWFDTIQELSKAGTLKGIIIDLRSNGGGMMNDAQYALGALQPKGGFQAGYTRFKRGVGRYDYSPLMPFVMSTLEEDHEVINDAPITLLVNAGSVSMSEMTSCCAKIMPNARIVGRRTHGGLCALVGTDMFSYNYNGHIGVQNKTPVYCYTPTLAFFNMDKKCLEGIGVEPDIEVALDCDLYKSTLQDTQLDRALEYIRTGK